jgi:TetR/AcrR family fatty acid metabolism transcriptional regulator
MQNKKHISNTSLQKVKAIQRTDMPIKDVILHATAKIMNEKGFTKSSISEIALEAGVKDPVIYQHFKGKEDLLFSIVQTHMDKGFEYMDEQLQGISGAHNKLRKFIWAHLRNNDVDRESITLVLLECRSISKFYQSDVYKMIRRYAHILTDILREGVREGIFRPDVNLTLIRDLIFGLLDFQAITCLVTREIPEATLDHEQCMCLIERILLSQNTAEIENYGKRQNILSSAIKVFSEKGYNDATISEIAQLADVATGTVYEYFRNKEELLLAIPEERLQHHLAEIEKAFTLVEPLRKLRRFVKYHFNLYLVDRDFLKVWINIIILNRRFYRSRSYESLQQYMRTFEVLVKEGIDDGSFAPDTNVRVFRNLFLGVFTHMVLRWLFLSQRKTIDMVEEINEVTDLLADALTTRSM